MVCIEILDIGESALRIAHLSGRLGNADKEAAEGAFKKPFFELTPKELKQLEFKRKEILLILPEDCCRAAICDFSAGEPQTEGFVDGFISENLAATKDSDVRRSVTGEVDGCQYGIAASMPAKELEDIHRVFKGYNLKYVMPRLAAYALGCEASGQTGIVNLWRDKLEIYVYHDGILMWSYSGGFQAGDSESASGAVAKALVMAGSKRVYPAELCVTGSLDNMEDIAGAIVEATGVPCRPGGEAEVYARIVKALHSTKGKGEYRPINYMPKYGAVDRWLRMGLSAACLALSVYAGLAAYQYLTILPELSQMRKEQKSQEYVKLQEELQTVTSERVANAYRLDELTGVMEGGVKLSDVMSVSEQFKPEGINILAVTDSRITGFSVSFDAVTRYVIQVSEQLGAEVDIENILQLELPETGTVIGFEVKF